MSKLLLLMLSLLNLNMCVALQDEEVMSKLGRKFQDAMKDPQLQVGSGAAAGQSDWAGGRCSEQCDRERWAMLWSSGQCGVQPVRQVK